ncbi:helix-turn-helix domain-containing protein [Nonomuraea rubra]|uniref:AraC-like DNA-binding protein n=1 Tax=Nonomuraea rubra TaxID=46180 RepID=A0A7X0NTU1_9ACTN|nr:helix-turn-helix domain-containing protein [Nonomuraea rubra]MBB6549291.1 AraC-like DNA-binding protein [Nonomuraea rubra]
MTAGASFDLFENHLAGLEVTTAHDRAFQAGGREADLGAVQVAVKSVSPMTVRRRRTGGDGAWHDEQYQIVMPVHGTITATWGARDAKVTPGEVYAHDMARLEGCAMTGSAEREEFEMLLLAFPRSLLPFGAADLDGVLGRSVRGTSGLGAVLRNFTATLADRRNALGSADRSRLGVALVDLVTAFLAAEIEESSGPCPGGPRHGLALRVQAYILTHLRDPGLSPREIAAAHHISVSYLHRLFQGQSETVAAWIKGRRLERARRDLADPAFRALPIHAVAARWGFVHPADFSRSFRTAYGMTPSDFRHHALTTPG